MIGLIVFGLIGIIIGIASGRTDNPLSKFKSLFIIVGVIFIALGVFNKGVKQIEAGTVGVKKLFGDVQEGVLYQGLNFVNPFLDIVIVDIKQQNLSMQSETSEGRGGESAISVLTSDGLQVNIDLSVIYRVDPLVAPKIIEKIGVDFEKKRIKPVIRSKIRNNATKFSAVQLYSEKREEFEKLLRDDISEDFDINGFVLEDLLVRKIDLPTRLMESIEQKLTADQEAQRMQFVLQKEIQEAERKRVEARGVADAQKILDSGLTRKVLQYEQIQVQKELVKSQNAKVILLGNDNKTPIILNGER
jgi:regulator of protease activity HflC (stomatin/prohibitin superfamily)